MRLNPDLYNLIVESAPSMSNRKVYVSELAEIDDNYEEQLRLIRELGINVKKFKEISTSRIFIRVIEKANEKAPETGASASEPLAGSDRPHPETSLPTKNDQAPVSTMSPAESPATPAPPRKEAAVRSGKVPADAADLTTTFLFRAIEIESKHGKSGSKIWIKAAEKSDSLVASSFAQDIGKKPFLVFLKPAEPVDFVVSEDTEKVVVKAVKEGIETGEIDVDRTFPESIPDEVELVEEELIGEERREQKTADTLNDELSDQIARGELDTDSAMAQKNLMTQSAGAPPVHKRPV